MSEPEEIRQRMERVARRTLGQSSDFLLNTYYWDAIERQLIVPAVENLSRADVTPEQIDGTEEKLKLIVRRVKSEERKEARRRLAERARAYEEPEGLPPVLSEQDLSFAYGTDAADAAISRVKSQLCPIWPFC